MSEVSSDSKVKHFQKKNVLYEVPFFFIQNIAPKKEKNCLERKKLKKPYQIVTNNKGKVTLTITCPCV